MPPSCPSQLTRSSEKALVTPHGQVIYIQIIPLEPITVHKYPQRASVRVTAMGHRHQSPRMLKVRCLHIYIPLNTQNYLYINCNIQYNVDIM